MSQDINLLSLDNKMVVFSSITLSLITVIAGLLSAACVTPPNPSPRKSDRYQVDRIGFLAGSLPTALKCIIIIILIYHTVLALFRPSTVSSTEETQYFIKLCPRPDHLNSTPFTWNGLPSDYP